MVLVLQHSIKQRSLQGSSELNSPIFGSLCIFCVCFHSPVYLVCLFVYCRGHAETSSLLDTWRIINLMRVLGAVLGWVLVSAQPSDECTAGE